jgi:eukaryotic translation initiation factor 2C
MTELEKSIVRFKDLPHSDVHPLRPGFGTVGTKIFLRANFFQVQFKKGLIIYDYDVKITPKLEVARLKDRVFELLERKPEFQKFKPYIAHDRSQRMVCPRELPQPLSIDVTYVEEEETSPRPNAKTYTIEITKTGELHTDEMTK